MKIITRLLIFACAISAFAAQGPRHKSLRAYAMGNAHVAIVDGKEAIYYKTSMKSLTTFRIFMNPLRMTLTAMEAQASTRR